MQFLHQPTIPNPKPSPAQNPQLQNQTATHPTKAKAKGNSASNPNPNLVLGLHDTILADMTPTVIDTDTGMTTTKAATADINATEQPLLAPPHRTPYRRTQALHYRQTPLSVNLSSML